MTTKTLTKRINRVLAAVLTIVALGVGQGSAMATTKTVTYTITDIEQGNNTTLVTFTRSGDSFDTSQSTYTTNISNSALGNNGGSAHVSVQFADGFELNMSWSAGSNVNYTNNCFYPGSGKITYSVSCKDDNYYVTNLKLKGYESNDPWKDTDIAIDQQWRFNNSVTDSHSFGSVTFTYANAPDLSIFESPGANTYNIKSTADLRHLANYVNNGHENCSGLTFNQTQNITYTHTTAWNDATSTENNHTAIGRSDHRFCGTFDGQGYFIRGIRIYQPDVSCQGLFGYTGEVNKGGSIKRVNLADARITGYQVVGAIDGRIFQTTVEDCTVATDVCIHGKNLNSHHHGGIVGECTDGTVQRCISHVTLTNNNSCEFYGAIAGEVTGSKGKVKDCIAIGATVPSVGKRGAIAGHISDFSPERNYYYNCTVAGVANATGVGVGYDSSGSYPHDVTTNQGAQALYSLTLPSGVSLVRTASATLPGTGNATYTTGADIDGTQYFTEGSTVTLAYTGDPVTATGYAAVFSVNGTPIDGSAFTMPAADVTITVAATDVWGVTNTPAADGSADYPYLIGSKAALDLLAKNVNGTDGHSANEFSAKHFLQTADITYDGTENNYTPIGKSSRYFRGHYDGGGYSVSGININTTGNDVGLFGYVYTPGTVENVTLANSTIKGFTDVGGIVGYLYGDQYDPNVSNCRVESDVTIGAGSGSAPNHGGIVGRMQCGIIAGCYSAATITDNGLSNCKDFGGIVGSISGSVTEVKDCLFTGTIVTTSTKKGGIVGERVDGSTLTNNYYTASSLGGVNGSDQNGARRACTVTLGEDIALVGSETAYSLSGLTAIGTGSYALSYNDGTATTIYTGEGQTLTLTFTGTVPDGTTVVFSTTGGTLSGNTLTMPASDVTVNGGTYKNDYITHWQAGPDHDGSSAAKAYIITTPAGLQLLASETNDGNNFSGTYFKLDGDLDMSGVAAFDPIGRYHSKPFCGHFDGQSHTISGLTVNIDVNNYIGLFGLVDGSVSHLNLNGASITGYNTIGGIAGCLYSNSASLTDCHVVSTIITGTGENESLGAIVCIINSGGTVSGCTYHSTIVRTSNNTNGHFHTDGDAFNIGTGYYWNPSLVYGDISGGAYLDATQLFLSDDCDNSALIAAYAAPASHTAHSGTAPDFSSGINVTLRGRTLTKNGNWNTLCLPFDVTIANSPLAGDGVVAKVFSNTSSLSNTGELTLNFSDAPATITAGTPFIIKWNNTGVNLVNPVFTGVTISNTAAQEVTSTDGKVKFVGQWSPFSITDKNINEILYVASGNKIGYSKNARTLKSCRAHFWVKPNGTQQAAHMINIDWGDGEVNGITTTDFTDYTDYNNAWYTLDGRKLNAKPNAKGVYINNGKKRVIK